MTEVRLITEAGDVETAYAIRREVFVAEQAVPAELERDEDDATAHHVLAYVDGRPVGAGRLAVLASARGRGVGAALVRGLEEVARGRGLAEAVLASQTHAVRFYERLGYVAYGAEFDDAGIPHRWMRRRL